MHSVHRSSRFFHIRWLIGALALGMVLTSCGVSDSGGGNTAAQAAQVAGTTTPVPTIDPADPEITKTAIAQRLIEIDQTALAGTPAPKNLDTPTPDLRPTSTAYQPLATPYAGGAFVDKPSWYSSEYLFENMWGIEQNGQHLKVFAGRDTADFNNPASPQGVVVIEITRNTENGIDFLATDVYNTPSRSGSARITDVQVNGTQIRVLITTAGGESFVFDLAARSWEGSQTPPTATATPTVTPTPVAVACALYPIALHSSILNNLAAGSEIKDTLNGAGTGNFGWLTWTGSQSANALAASLTAPGDSASYSNPDDPTDHAVSVGDWVQGRPGVDNSQSVRDALNSLKADIIMVPIWDQGTGQGSNLRYRVASFAQVKITSYRLPGQNRISIIYQGSASCSTP